MKHKDENLKKLFNKYSERSKKIALFSIEILLLWVLHYAGAIIKYSSQFLLKYYNEINQIFILIGICIFLLGVYEYFRSRKQDSGYYDGWLSFLTMIIGMIITILSAFALITGSNYLIIYS